MSKAGRGAALKMRVLQVTQPKGPFELVERDVPTPGPGKVRIKVQAGGICHSPLFAREGLWQGPLLGLDVL